MIFFILNDFSTEKHHVKGNSISEWRARSATEGPPEEYLIKFKPKLISFVLFFPSSKHILYRIRFIQHFLKH